jgi:hypothetical protein
MKKKVQSAFNFLNAVRWMCILGMLLGFFFLGYKVFIEYAYRTKVLNAIIERLKADTRIAEVLVTDVFFNPITQKKMTTIKFLEYGADDKPLEPKYFSFAGNVIQFQSLVVRFDDVFVEKGDVFKGKSAYLFWKAFILDGSQTQEFEIAKINEVPDGYKIEEGDKELEEKIWREFWDYALNSEKALSKGIKNAQIEAPGTKFVPGILYTLRIEHDGGIRIDTQKIPEVLRGEKI